MTRKVWLEVSLNGTGRGDQDFVPVAVDDLIEQGIRCVEAGAAIVHFHPYDPETRKQRDDPDIYARVIEGIREKVDAIVYGTLPAVGTADAPTVDDVKQRYAAIQALAERGLIEWTVVDPGTTNFALFDQVAKDHAGMVYLNPEEHVRHGLAISERFGLHASYAIYEPGFLRLGAALKRRFPLAPTPIYRFMFSEGFTFGFPPQDYALEAYLTLLEATAPGAPWMIAGLAVDVRPLIASAVERGGHVRVGLEDAPRNTMVGNLEWVARAVELIQHAGGEPASAAEVRAALALVPAEA